MMHGKQQDLVRIFQTNQPSTDQRSGFKIKTVPCFHIDQTVELCLSIVVLPQIVLNQQEATPSRSRDPLHWLTIHQNKGGAQDLMTDKDPIQSPTQNCTIQITF